MFRFKKPTNYKLLLKRFGVLWLVFFLLKGIAWLAVGYIIVK